MPVVSSPIRSLSGAWNGFTLSPRSRRHNAGREDTARCSLQPLVTGERQGKTRRRTARAQRVFISAMAAKMARIICDPSVATRDHAVGQRDIRRSRLHRIKPTLDPRVISIQQRDPIWAQFEAPRRRQYNPFNVDGSKIADKNGNADRFSKASSSLPALWWYRRTCSSSAIFEEPDGGTLPEPSRRLASRRGTTSVLRPSSHAPQRTDGTGSAMKTLLLERKRTWDPPRKDVRAISRFSGDLFARPLCRRSRSTFARELWYDTSKASPVL